MNSSRGSLRPVAAVLLAVLLGVLVAACGSGDSSGDKSSSEKKASANATGTTGATGLTGTTGATGPVVTTNADPLAGGRFFAADSPWNTRIDDLPVAADSARMLNLAMNRVAVREVPGQQGVTTIVRRVNDGLFVNTDAWAPLIVEAGGPDAQVTRFVCRQSKCGAGPPKVPESIAIPASTVPDPRYDGWLSVIDRENNLGYDFWRARRQTDDMISYQYAKAWTLNGPGFSAPIEVNEARAVGARGTGLPLFAGMIGPSAGTGGQIDHALAISVPGLARRNFVQPASVTDGVGSPDSLPAGARIRLRANVGADRRALGLGTGNRRLKGERRVLVESILQALREYGAIVVDRAAVPTLYAPRGTSRRAIRGGELSWLSLTDFEVIQLPKIYKDPPLSKVKLEGPETGAADSGSTDSGTPDTGGGA
ncbi:MAG: hypothetical protein M9938_02470 [Solirubrobacterales bacterium]|nr:hypothetical protein [Solirubrobacterales bacterium]